ncbi:alpha-xylosidase [Cohnella sp. WQ 127256]|uniref:alpha-xylosidase n=1 Tax=Cohnella sp. WQ 127256 TaxID=2938790 RepID=UPI0021186B49|nr:alpha-xylosidase [Cohnella sp. WQ 127256]
MKFSDGNWLIQGDYNIISPIQVHSVKQQNNALIVYAAPKSVTERLSQLDVPLITITLFSPRDHIIGVRIEHFAGGYETGPNFELETDPNAKITTEDNEHEASLTSGKARVTVRKGQEWSIDFYFDGKRITGSGPKSIGYIESNKGETFVREQLDLGIGEYVYGLGERFTPFIKNGQSVDIWNNDGGTGTQQSYKNIPFYVTNKGYGVFVNQPDLVSYEIASERVSKVQFSIPGQSLEYYVIGGPEMKDVLERYTDLTGKPALPPAWSFGLWLTTSFTTNYDEATVNSFVDGMRERDIPLHVFHFDCFWMKAFHWTDFEWDPEVFPEPEEMLKRLKQKGLRICVWINPYISQQSRLFDEGKSKGYLIRKPNGDVWQTNKWQPGMGIVDFTNPEACEWYRGYLRQLTDIGVDSFKTDFGERIPTDVVYHDGSDPHKMHNYYTHLYNKLVFDVLEEKRGKGEAAVFARSATVGGQKFPVHWGGDCYAHYDSMAESLRGGLSLSLSGFGFWSHDIGGFENTSSADVYKRWTAFGLFSSHSRLHGNNSYRVPWLFDEEAVDVMRFFSQWKCRLMPYLFHSAVSTAQTGVPTMRAMVLEFGQDPTSVLLDRQYMLGESLLVAPIFNEQGEVSFYLPEGRWTHLFTGEVVEGRQWRDERHDYLSLPVYVRPNTLLAMGNDATKPDYAYAEGVELHAFELEDGLDVTANVPTLTGETALTVTVKREGSIVSVKADKVGSWSVVLRGVKSFVSVDGASVEETEFGLRCTPEDSVASFSITIN